MRTNNRHLLWSLFGISLLLSVTIVGFSQTESAFDGASPVGLGPGGPASSGWRSHNSFNGAFLPSIPLRHIGGRGEAGFDLVWHFPQTWVAAKRYGGANPFIPISPYPGNNIQNTNRAFGLGGPGVVYIRTGASYVNCGGAVNEPASTVTRIIFVAGNGSEVDLTDDATHGQAYAIPSPCSNSSGPWNAGRGTAFTSQDGSFARFTASSPILEQKSDHGDYGSTTVSGTLRFSNGVTYQVVNSTVTQIEDRNGNEVSLQYDGSSGSYVNWYLYIPAVTKITDSFNRVTTINYNDSSCGCLTIQYYGTDSGSGAATRVIKITTSQLNSSMLRSGYALQMFQQLFPNTGQASNNYVPTLASAIQLPDATQYSFLYNSYGELARVNLPAGAAYEYDYGDGHNGSGDGFEGSATDNNPVMIYRRLQKVREYSGGGSTVTSSTNYTVAASGSNLVETEVTYAGSTAVAQTVHTMSGSPLDTLTMNGTSCNAAFEGMETETDSGLPGQTVLRVANSYGPTASGCVNNPYLASQKRTLSDTGQVSQISYQYDQYNNESDRQESDWGNGSPGSLVRHTTTSYITDQNYIGQQLLRLPSQTAVYSGLWDKLVAFTSYTYDGGTLTDRAGASWHDTNRGTGFTYRGNHTSQSQSIGTSLNGLQYSSVTWRSTFDVCGNVVSSTDANGNTTNYTYTDGAFDKPNTVSNALGHTNSFVYDGETHQPVWLTDPNGVVTHFSYVDPLDRITQISRDNNGLKAHTGYYYIPSGKTNVVEWDQNASGDQALHEDAAYDGFGRTFQTGDLEASTPQLSFLVTNTQFDALGRVSYTTNPSRYTSNNGGQSYTNDGLGYPTTTTYDGLSRPTKVTAADGSVTTSSYSGNTVTVTDAANVQNKYTYDALGRLTSVVENPNGYGNLASATTGYQYDVLDDLTKVTQGSLTRTFGYDSLSRLISSTQPENGTIYYGYDANSNLVWKNFDGAETCYSYDALNRNTSKVYFQGASTDGAQGRCGSIPASQLLAVPNVTMAYDGTSANAKGRLSSVGSTGVSSTSYLYDSLGRVTASTQTTSGNTYSFAYQYNLAGAMTSETYPSGRTITTQYDQANRSYVSQGTLSGQSKTYVTSAFYAPHGGQSLLGYGNNVIPGVNYNSRLQPYAMYATIGNTIQAYIDLLWLNWPAANNGSLSSMKREYGNPGPESSLASVSTSYTYDSFNRLASVSDPAYWRNFNYDPYGNMWVPQHGGQFDGTTPTSNVYSNNRVPGSFDGLGNQLIVNGNNVSYYPEGQVGSVVDGVSGATTYYNYDGLGNRVVKGGPSGTTVYVYDANNLLAAEYSTVPQSASPCLTCYVTTDHLGSTRLVTDQNGAVIARHDYAPFGEEVTGRGAGWGPGTDNIHQKFTGQERDTETGMDFFQARYYGSALGRFTSPDPWNAGADPMNPQSWNMYAYVNNNPLNSTDPSGMTCVDLTNGDGDAFQGDNGDGQGCAAAGVSPSNEQQRSNGQDIQNPQQVDVNAQQTSTPDYLWTISTNEIPRYDPNDSPLNDKARTILTLADARNSHDLGCLGLGFATGSAGAAAVSLSQPTISKPFSQGGNPKTSIVSEAFRSWTRGARGGPKLPAFEGGPGTGRSLKYLPTNSVGGFWARWLPVVGLAYNAYAAYQTNSCLNTAPQ